MTDDTRLKFDNRLNRYPILHRCVDVKNGEGLRDGNEECIVGNVASWTYSTTVPEGEIARIELGNVGGCS